LFQSRPQSRVHHEIMTGTESAGPNSVSVFPDLVASRVEILVADTKQPAEPFVLWFPFKEPLPWKHPADILLAVCVQDDFDTSQLHARLSLGVLSSRSLAAARSLPSPRL